MNPRNPRTTWGVLALAAGVGLTSLGNGFVYDEVQAIVENPLVHSLAHSPRIWISSYWPAGLLYRPLTIQLFALWWWIGGGAPWVFHLINVLLYAGVTALVFRLARRLGLGPVGAATAAVLFAVHPVHVEVVANAVGQSELLAALFVLLAVERYLAWRAPEAGGLGAWRRAALAGCYLLAIAAKETGYVLLPLLAAVELISPGARPWRDRLRAVGPAFGLLAAVAVAGLLGRIALFHGFAGEVAQLPLRDTGLGGRVLILLAVVPEWARLLLWPAHLQAHYGLPGLPVDPLFTARHLIGLVLLGTAASLAIRWRRPAPVVPLGIVWVAIALAPVSNLLVATGVQLAERTLFLPSVGAVLAAGAIVARIKAGAAMHRAVRRGTAAVIVVLAGLGLTRGVERVGVWQSQDAFFARLVQDAPRSYRAQLAAGTYYLGTREFDRAEPALGAAHALYQNDPRVYETFGQLYRVQGRCGQALPIFEEGLARHRTATTLRARLIECALAVGDTARARGVALEAVAQGQEAFRLVLRRLGIPRSP
ncbi:MAG: hypothetical protein ACT4PM_14395 [Gemmatimonadales bacterium]